MNSLETNLRLIKQEKDEKILPENIKTGVQIFDVVGTLESTTEINNQDKEITTNGTYTADEGYTGLGTVTVSVPQTGDVPVKLFETEEAMQLDSTAKEGDLALVYQNGMQNVVAGQSVSSITFPKSVTLSQAITSDCYARISGSNCYIDISLNTTGFSLEDMYGTIPSISYTSTDGQHYTRSDSNADTYEVSFVVPSNINENITYFIQVESSSFEGVYLHNGTEYVIASTQLTLANPKELIPGKIAYGKNGLIEGDGSIMIPDNTFADVSAMLWSNIQKHYDNMEVRVLTDGDIVDKNIYMIQTRSDGVVLWDTSNVTDMQHMFNGCKNLTTIPLLNTSKVTNISNMFNGCTNLVSIPLLDTSNVTYMANTFYNCVSLSSIPQLDTSNVTSMNATFYKCTSLKEIPLLNTSKVTNTSHMFNGCESLETIPLLNTSKVTNMYYMFNGCKSLKTIPLLNTSNVTNMNSMFWGCTNLTTVPQLNTSKVTNMKSMFYGCTNLTTVPVLVAYNMQYMFKNCTNLSDESLNNILKMCTDATSYNSIKTLENVGLTSDQANRCKTLSNYSAFTAAGWTTGY